MGEHIDRLQQHLEDLRKIALNKQVVSKASKAFAAQMAKEDPEGFAEIDAKLAGKLPAGVTFESVMASFSQCGEDEENHGVVQ